jgi:hypothetical protein
MSEHPQHPQHPQCLPPLAARVAELVDRWGGLADEPWLASALATLADDLRAEAAGAGLARAAPPDRAVRLGALLGLSPFEYDLVLLTGLPEEHEAASRVARLLHPHGEPHVSMAAAVAALGLDGAGRRHLRRSLESGPLHRHRLVTGTEVTPLPERSLRLPLGLWSVLRGVDHWPDPLRPVPLPDLAGGSDTATVAATDLARSVAGPEPRVVVVTGDRRDDTELAALAAAALAAAGRRMVALPAADLDDERTAAWSAHVAARGAVPLVVGRPTGPPLARHPGPVVVATATVAGLGTDDRPVVTVDVPAADIGDAVAMWHRLLPEMNGAGAELAGLLRVGELGATRAVTDTRTAAATLDPRALSVEGVVAHVRRRTDVELPGSVRLTRPHASWDQLVLPDHQQRLLRSVVDRVRGQARVLHEWGFSTSARSRGGTRILLSGPPGTGKTLAAEVTAAALGLDLLVVDLAALVSKWLGETEKNIAEVFDAAERCQAVLFFDEADAVFGKRTDGSDAQSRWANLETAYLLGRMERFDGLVVLATNLRRNIDDAFVRRLDVVVELDDPDEPAREELWRRHLALAAPRAADVDLGVLAGLYALTGGLIRNAVLSAAFAAAASGRPIDQDGLIRAVHDEYRKAGRSFPGTPRGAARRVRGGT